MALISNGRFAPLYVAEQIQENKFCIGGGRPGDKVSWQVTRVRKDGFANAHRIQPEVAKEPEAQGYYLHAAEHGQKLELSIGYRQQLAEGAAKRRKLEPGPTPPIRSNRSFLGDFGPFAKTTFLSSSPSKPFDHVSLVDGFAPTGVPEQ